MVIRLIISLREAVTMFVAVDIAECSIRALFAGTTSSDSSSDVSITGRTIFSTLCGKLLAEDVDGMALSCVHLHLVSYLGL